MSRQRPPATVTLGCPDWLKTTPGRLCLVAGVVLVVVKFAAIQGWLPGMTGTIALAAVTLVTVAIAMRESMPLMQDAHSDYGIRHAHDVRRAWKYLVLALGAIALAASLHLLALALPERTALACRLMAGFATMACLALFASGTIALPLGKVDSKHRVAATLDLATLIVAGMVGFWIYALQPAVVLAQHDGSQLPTLVIALFAVASLILLGVVLLIPFRRREANTWTRTVSLTTGAILLVIGEIVPLCHTIGESGASATPSFVGWGLFALCITISARAARDRTQNESAAEDAASDMRFSMPFASIGLIAVMLFTSVVSRELWEANVALLLPAMLAALVFVVVRQTVIARENLGLAVEMKLAKEIAESANSARLQFLANISHDLRTPLNGVLGCSQILLREQSLTAKQKDLVKTVHGCGEHLRNLISDLLDLSKLEAGRLELAPSSFDLHGFLETLVKTFALEAQNKQIALGLDCTPSLPQWITCDRKRLQQILGNLLHNAIKFTEVGRVYLHARPEPGALVFSVVDTGCGILPDKISDLFQPFHVVDERSIKLEGTGLGLSICKKLAQKMGGDIVVSSVPGKGSNFSVAIPLQESLPVVEIQRTVVDYQGRRRRILVVDDTPANRIVLRTMLEPLDFLVEEADGAATALQQIRFARPDIVLLDLMMPGVDGFELCRQIHELGIVPSPVCLAVSAMFGEETQKRCLDSGFRELLNKPVSLDLLVEALRAHAGIEWSYGVIQPAPPERDPNATPAVPEPPLVAPPREEIEALLDLARRGFVRNIEARADQLAESNPAYVTFAKRVIRFAQDFKLKELAEWLNSLPQEKVHGSA